MKPIFQHSLTSRIPANIKAKVTLVLKTSEVGSLVSQGATVFKTTVDVRQTAVILITKTDIVEFMSLCSDEAFMMQTDKMAEKSIMR